MSILIGLENAPFSPAQRAWLNSFLAGALGLEQHSPSGKSVSAVAQPGAIYDRQHPFAANVLEVQPLTHNGSEKDVRFVAFDLRGSGIQYQVGDALGVYPENCPELVDSILQMVQATGDELVKLSDGRSLSARDALTKEYAITQITDQSLELLARIASDLIEAERLRALAEDDADGFLEGQDILDLLTHFPSARGVAISDLISSLALIQPRLYSISSSPHMHRDEVHLTVCVVCYSRDGCPRARKGVASTFLTERVQPGQKVRIFVQPSHGFRLPASGDTPIIMVGPGTGIAPFRAFLEERRALGAAGENWLIFGNQRRACDFLYQRELEKYLHAGVLTHLDTAFSRDQPEKIYVQHRMLEHGARIWAWLERGAHFYVCGDAKRMARDVDDTLQKIVAEHGGLSTADAKSYVTALVRAKRYQRDVY
jgi:sulfite reductase (NADPH) flavoprotein alpha-component